jgi:hypothetical protein
VDVEGVDEDARENFGSRQLAARQGTDDTEATPPGASVDVADIEKSVVEKFSCTRNQARRLIPAVADEDHPEQHAFSVQLDGHGLGSPQDFDGGEERGGPLPELAFELLPSVDELCVATEAGGIQKGLPGDHADIDRYEIAMVEGRHRFRPVANAKIAGEMVERPAGEHCERPPSRKSLLCRCVDRPVATYDPEN